MRKGSVPEKRVAVLYVVVPICSAGFLGYGWIVAYGLHWSGSMAFMLLIGIGMMSIFVSLITLR